MIHRQGLNDQDVLQMRGCVGFLLRLHEIGMSLLASNNTDFLSFSSGRQKSDTGLVGSTQDVGRAAFLLEAIEVNLCLCPF